MACSFHVCKFTESNRGSQFRTTRLTDCSCSKWVCGIRSRFPGQWVLVFCFPTSRQCKKERGKREEETVECRGRLGEGRNRMGRRRKKRKRRKKDKEMEEEEKEGRTVRRREERKGREGGGRRWWRRDRGGKRGWGRGEEESGQESLSQPPGCPVGGYRRSVHRTFCAERKEFSWHIYILEGQGWSFVHTYLVMSLLITLTASKSIYCFQVKLLLFPTSPSFCLIWKRMFVCLFVFC